MARELDKARAEAGVIGLNVVKKLAEGEHIPPNVRATAARTLLEFAGLIGKTRADAADGKDISERSADELRALIARLDQELGDRAKVVAEAETADIPSQVLDMLD